MRTRWCLLAILWQTVHATAATAQDGTPGLPIAAVSPAFTPQGDDKRVPLMARTSYWAEGGGIGAVLLGALGVAFAASGCSSGDSGGSSNCTGSVIVLGLLGAGVGFTIGSLIGARIPRGPQA